VDEETGLGAAEDAVTVLKADLPLKVMRAPAGMAVFPIRFLAAACRLKKRHVVKSNA
jgi:hypothetical protein